MPHLTVHLLEDAVRDHEPELISALTDAVVVVYGEWAREIVVVLLVGLPPERWGVGGTARADAAPIISFGIREAAFARPDADELVKNLVRGLTDAVGSVFGPATAAATQVELVATPAGRTAVGGELVDR